MAPAKTPGFGSGQRHGAATTWCDCLSRMVVAEAARELLAVGLEGPGPFAVVVLPVWLWTPDLAVGDKSLARDGGRLLLPARITTPSPVVVLAEGESTTVAWDAAGPGLEAGDRITVTATTQAAWEPLDLTGHDVPPSAVEAGTMDADRVLACLEALVADGQVARFEAVSSLERYVTKAVNTYHASLSAEVSDGAWLMDFDTKQELVGDILYGSVGQGPSPAMRLVDRGLDPATYVRAEPTRVVRFTVRRMAIEAIQRRLGDPKFGTRIREVAREMGLGHRHDDDAVALVTAEYRRRWPESRMGTKRVHDALTVARTAESLSSSIDDEANVHFLSLDSGSDTAVEALRGIS